MFRPAPIKGSVRSLARPSVFASHLLLPASHRMLLANFTTSKPAPNGQDNKIKVDGPPLKIEKPSYALSFTCKKCSTRSTHTISKQAYHNGTVLVECPGCKNRHLIADHLKIFSDKRITLEDILKAKGQDITKGELNGDIEIDPSEWNKKD